jgi:predicted metal-dependent peptidase
MALSRNEVVKYTQSLVGARTRILTTNGFYGLLLMHAPLSLDSECGTAATDGNKIYFAPKFLDDLAPNELDFVLMHEIMHIALQHCTRGLDYDKELFNIACDIVVNSNILHSWDDDLSRITLKKHGVAMHLAPNGEEGYNYTADEVYQMLCKSLDKVKGKGSGAGHGFDDHTKWGQNDDGTSELRNKWLEHIKNVAETYASRNAGNLPLGVERLLKSLKKAQTNWRQLLNDFVQEEICDYSFAPPDRRFADTGFFLPDYSERDYTPKNILFMVDTSASMSDDMVTDCYSEVYGALEQFNGRLEGLLGFFDAEVVEPKPFCDEAELKIIRPKGGGGTSFCAVFEYIAQKMQANLPSVVIMFTDGYAPFPPEENALGIPVLWIINNKEVTPPWGVVARIDST